MSNNIVQFNEEIIKGQIKELNGSILVFPGGLRTRLTAPIPPALG